MELKEIIERAVANHHSQFAIQDHERLGYRFHNRLREVPRLLHILQAPLELVHVIQHHHRAVDLIFLGSVRADAQ